MKKHIGIAIAAASLMVLACDNSEDARLKVRNMTQSEVTSLVLDGPEKTGNILDAPLAPSEVATLEQGVEPGTYTWRIEYGGGGLASHYDSAKWGVEVELFPGMNSLNLQESAGGL